MNAPLKATPPYTAQQLADMPYGEARAALKRQECAHMAKQHGADVLADARDRLDKQDLVRIECIDLQDRLFLWECYSACELCGTTGELTARGAIYSCPACADDAVELVYTDYDGNLVDEPEASPLGELLA